MYLIVLLLIYSSLVVGGSMLGGAIPSLIRLTHVRMQSVLSLVGGFMLGVAMLHMLPHAVVACGSLDFVMRWTLIGLLATFLMIRTLHFHQHGPTTHAAVGHDHAACDHHTHKRALSWTGVTFGLSVHTLMDGVAVGAAVLSEAGDVLPGLAVFLAVLLHKPLDALSITSLMASGGISAQKRQLVNVGVALMCPVGAFLVMGLARMLPSAGAASGALLQGNLLGMMLGISAGVFLCISLSDLLPEVQFHRHDRLRLSAALLVGVLCAYAIGVLEDQHAHALPAQAHEHAEHAELEQGHE